MRCALRTVLSRVTSAATARARLGARHMGQTQSTALLSVFLAAHAATARAVAYDYEMIGSSWHFGVSSTSMTPPYSSGGAQAECPPTLKCKLTAWGSIEYGGAPSADLADRLAVTEGTVSVLRVTSTLGAFAALLSDGSVVAWGSSQHGAEGLPEYVTSPPTHARVVSIASNHKAFAALHADGTASSWGPASHRGEGSPTTASIIVQITAAEQAFAALHADGSVSAWGNSAYGGSGLPATVTTPTSAVVLIVPARFAFCALHADGSVSGWGDTPLGATDVPSSVSHPSSTRKVVALATITEAIAALHEDGSVTTWGNTGCATCTRAAPASLTAPAGTAAAANRSAVIGICGKRGHGAFAAWHADGTVSAWGAISFGGMPPSWASSPHSPVLSIASNANAFAALHADGSVSAWGDTAYDMGAINLPASVLPSGLVSPVVSIHATRGAFACIHADGSVSSWGANGVNDQYDYGGSAPSELTTSPAAAIVGIAASSNDEGEAGGYAAFAALDADGRLTLWGDSKAGGAGAPTSVTTTMPGARVVSAAANGYAFVALVMLPPCAEGQVVVAGGEATNIAAAIDPSYSQRVCADCETGKMQPLANQLSCIACPAGSHQQRTGATSCDVCPVGTYEAGQGAVSCTPCAAGRFQPLRGQSLAWSCILCDAGTFQSASGKSVCEACPRDTYSGVGAAECTECYPGFECTDGRLRSCHPGTYSNGVGGCLPCERGHRCPGASDRVRCPLNRRDAPETNFTACAACPDDSRQSADGSSCVCDPGFFNSAMNATSPDSLSCDRCPVGVDCAAGGIRLSTLPVRPAFYRRSNRSSDVRKCPDAAENCGKSSACKNSSSGCHAIGSESCLSGLTGTYCRLCLDTHNTYYRPAQGARKAECVRCGETIGTTIGVGITLLLAALLVAYLLHRWSRTLRPDVIQKWRRVHNTYALGNKVKVRSGRGRARGGLSRCAPPALLPSRSRLLCGPLHMHADRRGAPPPSALVLRSCSDSI